VIGEQLRIPLELLPLPPPVDTRAEISRLWAAGYTTAAITRSLNGRQIPTPSGRGRWHPDSVRRHADPIAHDRWNAYIRGYRRRRR
jgi:hypothetical protein